MKLSFLVVYISTSAFDRLGHYVRSEIRIVWEITQLSLHFHSNSYYKNNLKALQSN